MGMVITLEKTLEGAFASIAEKYDAYSSVTGRYDEQKVKKSGEFEDDFSRQLQTPHGRVTYVRSEGESRLKFDTSIVDCTLTTSFSQPALNITYLIPSQYLSAQIVSFVKDLTPVSRELICKMNEGHFD